MPGWRAHFDYDPFGRDGKLYLFQERRDGATDVITSMGRNGTTVERVEPNVHAGEGIRVPMELLKAIADHINPPDTVKQDVITQLREDLSYERRRVDNVLERWVPGA